MTWQDTLLCLMRYGLNLLDAIKTLKENNIKSILLTGDNNKVAKSCK